jgi:hypothetical protein
MPKARYQVVDEQLEDQQMPSQVFAESDDVVELLRMRIRGYLILRHRQTGDHNIRVVREAQTIRPVS